MESDNQECDDDQSCVDQLEEVCHSALILYLHGSIVAPFLSFLFNHRRDQEHLLSDFLSITGTVQCDYSLISVRENRSIAQDTFFGKGIARMEIEKNRCPRRSNDQWVRSREEKEAFRRIKRQILQIFPPLHHHHLCLRTG